jgi:hypothetical protein
VQSVALGRAQLEEKEPKITTFDRRQEKQNEEANEENAEESEFKKTAKMRPPSADSFQSRK